MRIRNNSTAVKSYGYFSAAQSAVAKDLERLSTGYRINRAADDAAGLAVSEKMRMLITGYDRAEKNSREGVALIQTGEGALQEVHSMLNRVKELAEQSANGTYDDTVDRAALQKELDQLRTEVDRIAEGANFNSVKLFQDMGMIYEDSRILEHLSYHDISTEITEDLKSTAGAEAKIVTKKHDTQAVRTAKLVGPERELTGTVTSKSYEKTTRQYNTISTVTSKVEADGKRHVYTPDATVVKDERETERQDRTDELDVADSAAKAIRESGVKVQVVEDWTAPMVEVAPETPEETVRASEPESALSDKNPAVTESAAESAGVQESQGVLTLGELLTCEDGPLKNIIFYEDGATQTPSGGNTSGQNPALANQLKTEIVPQAVTSLLSKYTAFNYLTNASIGIGLKFYSDSGSSTLASVSISAPGIRSSTSGGTTTYSADTLGFTLSVNLGKTDVSTEAGRSALERTICHEMIHALMDESMTAGMLGYHPTAGNVGRYPKWFIEGMAQTASGPGNFVNVALDLNKNSTTAQITSALSQSANSLTNSNSSTNAQYGTGYLACMYLGAQAYRAGSGNAVNLSSPTAAADQIAQGLSTLLGNMINGASLDDVVKAYSGYNTASEFENRFATDANALAFVKEMLNNEYTGADRYTNNVYGGVVSGNLKDDNPLSNASLGGVTLFQLNTTSESVTNVYDSTVTVLSGGTTGRDGVSPSGTPFTGVVSPAAPITPVIPDTPPSTTPASAGVFTITGGTEGVDWEYGSDHVLTIKSGATIYISGGTKDVDGDGTLEYGSIRVADGVSANMVLSDVKINTIDGGLSNTAGIRLGNGGNTTISLTGSSKVYGSGTAAGIQVGSSGKLTIQGSGTIDVYGGSYFRTGSSGAVATTGNGGSGIGGAYGQNASGSEIAILSGTVNAYGGYGSAGVGASYSGRLGDISISGGTIKGTSAGHGAGVGGGWSSSSAVGNINITGGNIEAKSTTHGSGLGAGCGGTCKSVTISGNGTYVYAEGGDYGAGIGASYNTGKVTGAVTINSGTVIAKGGDYGSGIGAGGYGSSSEVKEVIINGGDITATGGVGGAGIGAGNAGAHVGSITINGGKITATGGTDGSGIGAGITSTATSGYVNTIKITSGDITATGGMGGAGIGAGANGSKVNEILISGGTVTATGGKSGSGIGVGRSGSGRTSHAGEITITGGKVTATGGDDGAGIGAGANGSTADKISISGSAGVTAEGGKNGAGIGVGSNGSHANLIEVGESAVVHAAGGENGAGIGAGANQSSVDQITIHNGKVTADGGKNGAGIGSGYKQSSVQNILIKGGLVQTKGNDNSMGIGSGRGSRVGDIEIAGGTVSAIGGWTNDANNLGGFSDTEVDADGMYTMKHPVTVLISATNISVKAGERGEGRYCRTDAEDPDGNKLFPFAITAKNLGLSSTPKGPFTVSVTMDDGTHYEWKDLKHEYPDGTVDDAIYVWIKGEKKLNGKISVVDGKGNTLVEDMNIYFFGEPEEDDVPDSGIFRNTIRSTDPIEFRPGTYQGEDDNKTYTFQIIENTTTVTETTTTTDVSVKQCGIRLQIGATPEESLVIPQFYFSAHALGLDGIDISTQANAQDALDKVGGMINRVSDIRGSYGALQNRLEHNITSLNVSTENLTAAESQIRDTDVADQMRAYIKNSIILQAAQAMLAQANQDAGQVMQLLQ